MLWSASEHRSEKPESGAKVEPIIGLRSELVNSMKNDTNRNSFHNFEASLTSPKVDLIVGGGRFFFCKAAEMGSVC